MKLTNLLRLEELQCSGNGSVVDRCQVYVGVEFYGDSGKGSH